MKLTNKGNILIDPGKFLNKLKEFNITFFAGVPDSLLKYFCDCIESDNSVKNITCANEGAAIALASGNYLSTNNIAAVYMQNSGIGNAANPLLSLTDPDVYSIPVLLIIGWRGEPGIKDEPQHKKQGKITEKLLETMGIPFSILDSSSSDYEDVLITAYNHCRNKSEPYALLIKENTFSPLPKTQNPKPYTLYQIERENAIKTILENIKKGAVIISTTGKISRELFELREKMSQPHSSDFLTVGSMGHASQIALGIAMNKPDKPVYCLDGDGAAIMHMGSLAISGTSDCKNFRHIILNNGAHDSVGGQATAGFFIDFTAIAKACGYRTVFNAETEDELKKVLIQLNNTDGPALLEIKVKTGSRKDLGRPTKSPVEIKKDFMDYLNASK